MNRSKPRKPAVDRRRRFAEEYVVDFNATQAAIRAGYAPRAAHVTGSRLLTDANVQLRIQELMAGAAKRAAITVDRTMQEIARVAYGDRRKLWDDHGRLVAPHEMDEDTAALVATVETEELYAGRGKEREVIGLTRKVKTWDKGRALEQCMSILGMHKSATPAAGEDNVLHLSIRLSGK